MCFYPPYLIFFNIVFSIFHRFLLEFTSKKLEKEEKTTNNGLQLER